MSLRDRLAKDLKQATKNRDALRTSTLRLINATIKDREIARRVDDDAQEISDSDIVAIISRMVRQRQESARAFEEGGRMELAERERTEITILEGYLPKQLSEAEILAAIEAEIEATGAGSIRDIGRVMAGLKERYAGQMDFGTVGPMVRRRLS
ncbi:GatB/YqeY domain-containing protein [Pararhodobacter sp. SW119]|uniref:GatB/YqeY domain-containing protein n=1 Tax=Pararhodobacter sp. SW119 TaxID=2780075 RepID=UPI001AE067F9|nr:GatB/YqeY domain-containing protein [Pararhodobacter sp. SW119]